MSQITDCFIPLTQTRQFSTTLTDYLRQAPELSPFYHRFPNPENYLPQIQEKEKSYPDTARRQLVSTLKEQYEGISDAPVAQIERLADARTFTLTTGHQLNIFSGPLYFHYKIMTVINAARQLNAQYPDYHFVPLYWMATEDHDLDEIRSFSLFGKKWTWETAQSGAVGKMHTQGLSELAAETGEALEPFATAYQQSETLAEGTRRYVHALYGDQGLLVLDADAAALKEQFVPVMEDDLFQHSAQRCVQETTEKLTQAGYSDQVFPRPINLFYLGEGFRERIEKQDDGSFRVLNTDLSFSADELKTVLHQNPERFSPNVVLRPLYQEVILPNLSYTGGPAEVVYWFQLRQVFVHFGVPFPMLLPRNFALYLNRPVLKKMNKAELSAEDLFLPAHEIKRRYVSQQADTELTLSDEKKALHQLFEQVATKAKAVDASLVGWVRAQEAQQQKALEKVAQRLRKAEEQKHETIIRQIEKIKEKLFPNQSLQERTENVLSFSINKPEFLKEVQERLHPFDFRLHVLTEEAGK